jgi:ribosomal protein S18 acetylase RimI-like enzyme
VQKMADLVYRLAEKEDLKPLQDFIDKYLRKDYFLPEAKLITIVSRKCSYICIYDNKIVGFIYVDSGKRLFNLFVHPEFRSQGIGKHLVELSKPKSVRCKINMSSGNPLEFYKQLGFGIMGEPIKGECKERGKKDKATKQKSILILIKGHRVPSLSEYEV